MAAVQIDRHRARELVAAVRNSVTIDWPVRENVRATLSVQEQAEVLSDVRPSV
jgi:hypothetical protein